MIYKPKGKAAEYAIYALNVYEGCSNGCIYCYAPEVTGRQREDFFNNTSVKKDTLNKLKNQLDSNKDKYLNNNIMMSLVTDCYQSIEKTLMLTRSIIRLINSYDIGVTILTKNTDLAIRDFDILSKNSKNEFATTLTCTDNRDSLKWEPNASLPGARAFALKEAKRLGVRTLVSLEPVLKEEDVYEIIAKTHDFVDRYFVGKLNYVETDIDWLKFRKNVTEVLERYGCDYMIKKELRDL